MPWYAKILAACIGAGILFGLWCMDNDPLPEVERAGEPVEIAVASGEPSPSAQDTIEHRYADGSLKSRSQGVDGMLNGLSEGWYTNGQLQVTEYFKDGVSHGLRTKWYPDGVKKSEVDILDGQIHGLYTRWHDESTPAEIARFKHGKPHGESLAYYPSGFLKAEVHMNDGEVVERTLWEDGERPPETGG